MFCNIQQQQIINRDSEKSTNIIIFAKDKRKRLFSWINIMAEACVLFMRFLYIHNVDII